MVSVALAALSLGCASVRPWERGALARRDMAWDPDTLEAQRRSHVYWSKEASLPGGGAGGIGHAGSTSLAFVVAGGIVIGIAGNCPHACSMYLSSEPVQRIIGKG